MKRIRPPKSLWSRAALGALGLLLVVYLIYQTKDLLRGPRLVVQTPDDNLTVPTALVEIRGEARRIAHLWLNGQLIFTDETGQFKQKLLLAPGYNIISLEARDKFDRSTSQTLHLVYAQKT